MFAERSCTVSLSRASRKTHSESHLPGDAHTCSKAKDMALKPLWHSGTLSRSGLSLRRLVNTSLSKTSLWIFHPQSPRHRKYPVNRSEANLKLGGGGGD